MTTHGCDSSHLNVSGRLLNATKAFFAQFPGAFLGSFQPAFGALGLSLALGYPGIPFGLLCEAAGTVIVLFQVGLFGLQQFLPRVAQFQRCEFGTAGREIGRASCRESGESSVGARAMKQKRTREQVE